MHWQCSIAAEVIQTYNILRFIRRLARGLITRNMTKTLRLHWEEQRRTRFIVVAHTGVRQIIAKRAQGRALTALVLPQRMACVAKRQLDAAREADGKSDLTDGCDLKISHALPVGNVESIQPVKIYGIETSVLLQGVKAILSNGSVWRAAWIPDATWNWITWKLQKVNMKSSYALLTLSYTLNDWRSTFFRWLVHVQQKQISLGLPHKVVKPDQSTSSIINKLHMWQTIAQPLHIAHTVVVVVLIHKRRGTGHEQSHQRASAQVISGSLCCQQLVYATADGVQNKG